MALYLITYDLQAPGKDYAALLKAIRETLPDYWHCLDSTWLVQSQYSSVQIRDHLNQFIDSNDKLLVAIMGKGNGAWHGFDKECNDWLVGNL